MKRAWLGAFVLAAMALRLAAAPLTVGVEGRREVILPEAGLKAAAPDRAAPITLRIAAATAKDDGMWYDLRFIGLVPGRYDLGKYLSRADGSPAEDLPALEVEVQGLLPPGQGAMLLDVPDSTVRMRGGYRWMMAGVVVAWVLAAVPLFRRKRRAPPVAPAAASVALTLPERVRPLVEQAAAGTLRVEDKAELERMVLAHWCEELGIGDLPRAEALARFRDHPQAGALLRALEAWLHRPPGGGVVDLEPLLAVYAPNKVREVTAA